MSTQAELLRLCRDLLDDPNAYPAGRYTDNELRRWLNMGARDVATRAKCIRGNHQIATTANLRSYVIPANQNVIEVHKINYITADDQTFPLDYKDQYNADREMGPWRDSPSFYPRIWTSWDTPPTLTVQIHPAPSVTGGELDVYFFKYPAALATESTADQALTYGLPAGWDDLLVHFVCAKAAMKDKDMQGYEMHLGVYGSKLNDLVHISTRYTDQGGGGIMYREELYADEAGGWGW